MAANLLMTRMNIYKLLSTLYKEPGEALVSDSKLLIDELKEYKMGNLVTIGSEMLDYIESEEFDNEKVLVDFARLFVGPFALLAAPYSSIYLENKREIMGTTTHIVESFYKRSGLDFLRKNEPADHICFQLEYVYYLFYNINNKEDKDKYISLLIEFYEDIFSRWIPDFTDKVVEEANTGFYKYLAQITAEFIKFERKLIEELSE